MYVSEFFCVSPQGDEAVWSKSMAQERVVSECCRYVCECVCACVFCDVILCLHGVHHN